MTNSNNNLVKAHQPHDTGYKYLLTSKRIFKELLDSFVKEGWVDKIDENALHLDDKTYILPDFSKKEADLVYHLKIKDQEVIFYTLVELQSTVDFQMPHRLLFYMTEIWRSFLKNIPEEETKRKHFRLPAIVPMVIYNGSGKWTVPQSYRQALSAQEHFGDYVLDFKYILIDINRFQEKDLLEMPNLIKSVFLMDRIKDQEEVIPQLHKMAGTLKILTMEDYRLFRTWAGNILSRSLPMDKQAEMAKIIKESDPEEVDEMISNVTRVLKEAFEKTQTDSLAEGEMKEKTQTAKRMLAEGMPVDLVVKITGLSHNEIREINRNT